MEPTAGQVTESEQLLNAFDKVGSRLHTATGRIKSAAQRLTYSKPQDREANLPVNGSPAKNSETPPFSARLDGRLHELNHLVDDLEHAAEHLETFL